MLWAVTVLEADHRAVSKVGENWSSQSLELSRGDRPELSDTERVIRQAPSGIGVAAMASYVYPPPRGSLIQHRQAANISPALDQRD